MRGGVVGTLVLGGVFSVVVAKSWCWVRRRRVEVPGRWCVRLLRGGRGRGGGRLVGGLMGGGGFEVKNVGGFGSMLRPLLAP